ncbi:MAG: hypothetical protein JSS66_01395 [Armatimonadetes bacterium]|nr:hypothetical protein [Armatimonadota bacterium]
MSQVLTYPCSQCGAKLEYSPGTTVLKCPYCGHETPIVAPTTTVDELDIQQYLDKAHLDTALEKDQVLHCTQCAAEFTVPATQEAARCPFCGSDVVIPAAPEDRIVPNGLLPFQIDQRVARSKYQGWVSSRFWAPNDLKKLALAHHGIAGIYIPYWTYDSQTSTEYTGMRGEHYYETESYTDSDGNRQTREVQRTAWYPASGSVDVPFDDILVLGSDHLPSMYAQAMSSWKLEGLVPYEPAYLSGFQAMRYSLDLATCWDTAKHMMISTIDQAIRSDIGGDEQQITSKNTVYFDVTFKHVLLPIWSGAYRYRGKSWRFLVNGQTGEVRGEAPVSVWKVLIAVLLGLLVMGGIAYVYLKSRH